MLFPWAGDIFPPDMNGKESATENLKKHRKTEKSVGHAGKLAIFRTRPPMAWIWLDIFHALSSCGLASASCVMKSWDVSFFMGAFPEDHPKISQKLEYKMKNQWFGDIHDFRKYGLLRFLRKTQQFKRILIAWMLTPSSQGESNGKFRSFIRYPGLWKKCDPELFNILKDVVTKPTRNVKRAFELGILPHETFVPFGEDDEYYLTNHREEYFRKIGDCDCDLVFLDADNGLEVASMRKCEQSKYIFYREVKALFDAGKSILIYQHRAIGQNFEEQLSQKMKVLPSKYAIVFIGGNVSYILLCRNNKQKKEITKKFCNQKYSERYLKLQTIGEK